MAQMRDFIVGTAGHIDHGKTTLLKALTGINADRLEEERRRGITIDIGFAHLHSSDYRIGFVDVPGHERFVKNMLAGIGGIRLALLVIAADESIMPQTREHFQICQLLGIRRGIIVLTKTGLVDSELLELVIEESADLVRGSFLESAPVVPVDSLSGEGIDTLKATLLQEVESSLNAGPQIDPRRSFRMPIDRVFTRKGFGTVITGTVSDGRLPKDATVALYPDQTPAKVRGIQIFEEAAAEAVAGQRAAINLSGVDKAELSRGMVVGTPETLNTSFMLDVSLTLLEDAPAELKHRDPVRFHHGASETIARVHLLEDSRLSVGSSAIVQLRLDRPVCCSPLDRFIIRRYSPMRTIGGGIVLDPAPPKHRRKTLSTALPALRALARQALNRNEFEQRLLEYLVVRSGPRGLPLPEIVRLTGWTPDEASERLANHPEIVLLKQEPFFALWRDTLSEISQKAHRYLDDFHRRHPLQKGVPQQEAKAVWMPHAPQPVFLYLLNEMQSAGIVEVTAGTISLAGRAIELSSQQRQLIESILDCHRQQGLRAPTLEELIGRLPADAQEVRNLYYYLLESGQLTRISAELVLSASQVDRMVEQIRDRFKAGQDFGVADFKEIFEISRKYAIPLLEYLDRQKITRRAGDKRTLL